MIANELGEFTASCTHGTLPSAVRELVKHRILDTIGSAILGVNLRRHELVERLFKEKGGVAVWGTGKMRSSRDAATLNSFLAHCTYIDDGDRSSGLHPGCVTVPSVLALALERRSSGHQVISAVAAGYEVLLRVGRAIYPSTVTRGFQSTAVVSAIGSAAACANLLGISKDAATNAIAIAANLGVGLKGALQEPSTHPIQVARGCEGGMLAALYAEEGAKAWHPIIENSFVRAFSDQDDHADVLTGLGESYRLEETYIKRHGGCRGCHAAIDVVESITAEHAIRVADIKMIEVVIDEIAFAGEIHQPTTGEEAQFSVPFAVAVMLIRGSASVAEFNDKNLQDPRIRSLMGNVKVIGDSSRIEGFPANKGALARVVLNSGREYRGQVSNPKGEPEFPLSRDDIVDKFMSLTGDVLDDSATQIKDIILRLEQHQDISLLNSKL